MDPPVIPDLGYESWSEMSGISPAHPLVGGNAGQPGYEAGQRRVAIADPSTSSVVGPSSGSPASGHYSELMNLKGNPIGWVLIASIIYLGLTHLHVRAGAGVRYR